MRSLLCLALLLLPGLARAGDYDEEARQALLAAMKQTERPLCERAAVTETPGTTGVPFPAESKPSYRAPVRDPFADDNRMVARPRLDDVNSPLVQLKPARGATVLHPASSSAMAATAWSVPANMSHQAPAMMMRSAPMSAGACGSSGAGAGGCGSASGGGKAMGRMRGGMARTAGRGG